MKCPNCGIDEPIKGEYCIHCGSNLELTPERRSERRRGKTPLSPNDGDVPSECSYHFPPANHCPVCNPDGWLQAWSELAGSTGYPKAVASECERCDGKGWYAVEKPNYHTGDAEIQQEQCANCYGTGKVEQPKPSDNGRTEVPIPANRTMRGTPQDPECLQCGFHPLRCVCNTPTNSVCGSQDVAPVSVSSSDWLAAVCERCGGSWIADYALGSTYHCDTCGNRRDEENPHKHEWLTLPHGATCKLCGLEIYDGTDDGG